MEGMDYTGNDVVSFKERYCVLSLQDDGIGYWVGGFRINCLHIPCEALEDRDRLGTCGALDFQLSGSFTGRWAATNL